MTCGTHPRRGDVETNRADWTVETLENGGDVLTTHEGLYTDESPGLKVDPVVVLVLSVGFIISVVALHGKLFCPIKLLQYILMRVLQSSPRSPRSSPHKLLDDTVPDPRDLKFNYTRACSTRNQEQPTEGIGCFSRVLGRGRSVSLPKSRCRLRIWPLRIRSRKQRLQL